MEKDKNTTKKVAFLLPESSGSSSESQMKFLSFLRKSGNAAYLI